MAIVLLVASVVSVWGLTGTCRLEPEDDDVDFSSWGSDWGDQQGDESIVELRWFTSYRAASERKCEELGSNF